MTAEPVPRLVSYGDHPDQFVEVWDPVGPTAAPATAVLIHGGYWRQRYGLDLMHPMAAHLAGRGWRVVNIEYRRIDDHHDVWEEMSADVQAAVALARLQASGGDGGGPVVVIGHSAGGQLALWSAARAGSVDAVVALAPVADLAEADRRDLSDGAVRQLLGGGRAQHPERYRRASPIELLPLGVDQLVVHGQADDAVPLALAVRYVEAVRSAGDEVAFLSPPGVDHFHIIDPGHAVWAEVDTWMDRWSD